MSTKGIISKGACTLIILMMFGTTFGQGVIGNDRNNRVGKSTGFNTSQYEKKCYSKVVNEWGRRDTLLFRMLKPVNYNASGTPYPIIVMFHGRGEAGTDNNYQLLHGGQQHLNAVNNGQFNGFVVFPQEPFGYWANSPSYDASGNQPSPYLRYAWEMVDVLITQYNIDPDRIVFHGLSAGGTATWATMYNRPDLVAGTLPMSTPGDPSQAHKISPASIWLFQGGKDTNPIPAISDNMYNTLGSVGCDTTRLKTSTTKSVKYTVYPTIAHDVWNTAYAEPDFFPFILRQNKKNVKILGKSVITAGQSTNLGIAAGLGEYQWYKDGVIIDGAKSFRLDGVTQGGNYYVMFRRSASNPTWVASSTVTITCNSCGNVNPTVSITSPATNTVVSAPATVTIAANASDVDGTVSKVEFYNGATLLGTDFVAPFSYQWSGVPAGTYSVIAKATDNSGGTSTSTITLKVNSLPSISITAPVDNASFTAPASVAIAVSASDADGTVSKVEFYNGANLIGTVTNAPYAFNWSNVAAGTYNLTAKATDNVNGTTTSAAINVVVNTPPNQLPTVSLTSPTNNASFTAPATIALTASASDVDGTVAKVEFFNGATLLGTSTVAPYSFNWSNVAAGTYALTAKATDNAGDSKTSSIVNMTVNTPVNQLPTVSITSPANNASFTAPANVSITASASDVDGTVTKVEFFNGATLLGTVTTAPYAFNWSNVAVGTYILTARAMDNDSAVKISSPVSITVTEPANQLPLVSLTAPANNASYTAPATVLISASASDVDGTISKVEFFNGATLLGTATVAPYSFSWSNVAAGTYALTAKATDNTGNSKTSSIVSITVSAPNQLPTVGLTSPANNASFTAPATVALTASASDVDGIVTKVEFFSGATLLGSDTTSPYVFTWPNVAVGTYALTAKATDNTGDSKTSSVVNITVTAPVNQLPTVSLTAPSNNASYTAPATVLISASASDVDGTISKVEFFNGATLLGTATVAPYSFSWSNVAAGTYALTAKATDNAGGSKTSSIVNITVAAPVNQLPTVSLTAPANNASYTAPATVLISASASDVDGTISKVEFYNGATLLGTSTVAPYSFSWSNVVAGTYTLTAKATDNSGGSKTSTSVSVVVNSAGNQPPLLTITAPAAGALFIGTQHISIEATASDPGGSVSKLEFYVNDVLIGTDQWSPYQMTVWNVQPGSYTVTVKATDNLGAVTTQSVPLVVNDNGIYVSSSLSCLTAGQTVILELDASQRVNATKYSWWYSGTGLGLVSTVAEGFKATGTIYHDITSGQVCVGVNYTSGYKTFCKSINKCVSARVDNDIEASTVSNNGNGASTLSVNSSKDIASINIVTVTGAVLQTVYNVSKGEELELFQSIPAGLHLVYIQYVDGSKDIQKVLKAQ